MKRYLEKQNKNKKKKVKKVVKMKEINPHLLVLVNSAKIPVDMRCTICMNPIFKGCILSCGHSGCWNCINMWITKNKNCFICRKTSSKKDMKIDPFYSQVNRIVYISF